MAEDRESLAERLEHLDEELVPLPVAATVAYFQITEAAQQVAGQAELAQAVERVAIALSTVVPIYRGAGALSEQEVNEVLCRPLKERRERARLDDLAIRRGDLRRAMATLKRIN